ncbi:MAG: amidohydrolase [Treponema sp.]|jgi:amidohydrolase|nr:amidohydrolase [Treponema sp.]
MASAFGFDVFDKAKENMAYSVETRRHLHRHPELSRLEFETLKYIKKQLEGFGIPYVEVEDGGIFGFLGDEKKGKTVLLRADIDALPIQENEYNLNRKREVISENPGIQHACGHDAHTAILLTVAKILKGYEANIPGRVLLMFERGEEGGGNIRQLLAYIEKENIHIDGAHALHVKGDEPAGKIEAVSGPVQAGACGFNVTITGKGGHSSRPDKLNNPLDCFVSFYQSLKDIRLKHISPFDQATIAVGAIKYGNKGNVIPDTLSFEGSARIYSEEAADIFFREFDALLTGITGAHHCGFTHNAPRRRGLPVINNDLAASLSQRAIKKFLGGGCLVDKAEPSMGSESFSLVSKLYPAVNIKLGVGNAEKGCGAGGHTDRFDLDEDSLPLGVAATIGFAWEFLNNREDFRFKPYAGNVLSLFEYKQPE